MIKLPKFNLKNKKSPSDKKEFIALELGSSSIKTGIFSVENQQLQLIGHSNLPVEDFNPADLLETNLKETTNKIQEALEESKTYTDSDPQEIIVGIPSSYIVNDNITIRFKRTNSHEKINEKEVKQINKKVTDKARLEAEKSLQEQEEDELQILNSEFTHIKIDGYLTKQIQGFRGSTVEISQFTSFSKQSYLDKILNIVQKNKLKLLTVTSSVYAFSKNIPKEEEENYILLNFTGRNTDISIVFGSEIRKLEGIKIGPNSFNEYISKVANISKEEVIGSIRKEGIKETYEDMLNLWVESTKEVLNEIEGIKVLPNKVIIYGEKLNLLNKDKILAQLTELKFKDSPYIETKKFEDFDIQDHTENSEDSLMNLLALGKFALNLKRN